MTTPTAAVKAALPTARTDEKGAEFGLQEARYADTRPALIIVGDSLGAMWNEQELGALGLSPIAKLSVHGDLTQNVLWRLQNTAVDLSDLKLAVVIAGTNNLTVGNPADEIFEGLLAIVQLLRTKAPAARIAVMQPPPRMARRRYDPAEHAGLNRLIMEQGSPHGYIPVKAPDIDPSDGELYKDGIHLYRRTYRLLTQVVKETIEAA
jgi:hypothetical protein